MVIKSFSVWTTPSPSPRVQSCIDAMRVVYPAHEILDGSGCPYRLSGTDYRYDSDVIRLWYMSTYRLDEPLMYGDCDVIPIGNIPYSVQHVLPAYLECRNLFADIAIMYRPAGCERHYQGMLDWYVQHRAAIMDESWFKTEQQIGWPQSLLNFQGYDNHEFEYIKNGWFTHHEYSMNPTT